MKLYFSSGACSLSPHIVLLESGLAFTTERVDLARKLTMGGLDYHTINRKGYVPALQLSDGTVLTEGPAILQYIADQAPETNLVPPAGIGRYRVIEWLNFISTELHKNFAPFFNPIPNEDMKQAALPILTARFAYVERMLEGNNFLAGSQFTAADAYLFTIGKWAEYLQFDLPVGLQSYLTRVGARPAVQKALSSW